VISSSGPMRSFAPRSFARRMLSRIRSRLPVNLEGQLRAESNGLGQRTVEVERPLVERACRHGDQVGHCTYR
jgi:hypothetical protein